MFVNKTLLSHMDLDAPMFIAFSQTVITAVICYIKRVLSDVYPKHFKFPDVDVWDIYIIKAVSEDILFKNLFISHVYVYLNLLMNTYSPTASFRIGF